jgi:hypothetical protein
MNFSGRGSVVEHSLGVREVAGSIPVGPMLLSFQLEVLVSQMVSQKTVFGEWFETTSVDNQRF